MIGLFGGTFDPVHYGHLRAALEVKELFGLDHVRLIPCSVPPHRAQPCASAAQRLDMLKLAVEPQPALLVDSRELEREGRSFMVDTLKSLRADFPGRPLLLFIGCDAFNGLTSWHRWQCLFDYAHVAILTRPGYAAEIENDFLTARLTDNRSDLNRSPAGRLLFQPITPLDISSTAIRQLIAENRNPGFLLPDAVIEYIRQNKLYEINQ